MEPQQYMDLLLEQQQAIGRIEAKVDTLLAQHSSHTARLQLVERKQWITSGGVAVIVALMVPKLKAMFGVG